MKPKATTKRSPKQIWDGIDRERANDEMARILALSPAELDAELRAHGFDPDQERALGERQAREAPKIIAAEEHARDARARAGARLRARREARGPHDVAARRERIARLRNDPRLSEPFAILFRNRSPEDVGREELEAILDEMEDLADDGRRSDRLV